MKRFLSILLAGVMLAGCGADTSEAIPEVTALPEEAAQAVEEIAGQAADGIEDITAQAQELGEGVDLKILSPSGAPALAMIPAVLGGCTVDFVDGADPLQAALVNPTPEYDIIIAPSNLGMKLAESGKSSYKMLGIVTWGNLYIVAKKGTSSDPAEWTNIASFGEQSVTGKVFSEVFGSAVNMDDVTWYNSTAEAAAALLSGAADVAMLAEPNATTSIAKAKENGLDLEIIANVQDAYAEGNGFPQAALFVREDAYEEKKADIDGLFALAQVFSLAANDLGEDKIAEAIESAGGAETFGIPSSEIAAKVWKRLNIKVVPAKDRIEDLKTFGEMFGITDVDSLIIG